MENKWSDEKDVTRKPNVKFRCANRRELQITYAVYEGLVL